MSRAPDLSPIDATVETETITFDYGRVLIASAVINSATVTCSATKGLDNSAASRLVGSLSLIISPSSGQPLQAVAQQVGTMVANEVYRLACIANINDGQKLEVWTHLPAVNPN